MNKERKEKVAELITKLNIIKDELTTVIEDEHTVVNRLPGSFWRKWEQGDNFVADMEYAVDCMEQARNSMRKVIE